MANKYDKQKLLALIRDASGMADEALAAVAQEMADEIKLSFGTSPAGRQYRRGRKYHTASVEGYPPNVDTNALRASIRSRKTGKLKHRIEDGVEYGVWLELGTPSGKIKKRPFVRPVFEAWGEGGKFAQRMKAILEPRFRG